MTSSPVLKPHIDPDADGTFDSHYYPHATVDAALALKADQTALDTANATLATRAAQADLDTATANLAAITPASGAVTVGSGSGPVQLASVVNQIIMPDGDTWGTFAGSPVLMSNWSQDKIPTDGVTGAAAKLSAFFARAASLKMGAVLLPGYTYIAETTLTGVSNLRLSGYGAKIFYTEPSDVNAPVLSFQDQSNILIEGLEIDGNKAAFATSTQQRHCVKLQGCTNVTLRDLDLHDAKGDPLYIGTSPTDTSVSSQNVYVSNVKVRNGYRNNISLVGLEHGTFVNVTSTGAGGTAPQAGMDIEPNVSTTPLRDLTFVNCHFDSNFMGAYVSPYRTLSTDPQEDFRFLACTFNDNTNDGFSPLSGVGVSWEACSARRNGRYGVNGPGPTGGRLAANWQFRGGTVEKNGSAGMFFFGTISPIDIDGVMVKDNGQSVVADGISLTGTHDLVTVRNTASIGATQRFGVNLGSTIANLTMYGGDLRGNGTGPLAGGVTANFRRIRDVVGYVTRNSGVASVAHGGTIAHGLVRAPGVYSLTPTVAGRRVAVTAASTTTLTVSLQDASGANVTTAENVAWLAEV